MNDIKLYLKSSGSYAEIIKDFNLYKGCYHNVQITVYVPKEILYDGGEYSNAVKICALLTAENGKKVTTEGSFLDYVKEETFGGLDYAVYTRLLPKEFTLCTGTQTLIANVVSIDNTDEQSPTVISVTTTQTTSLVVLESAYADNDQTLEPSQVEALQGQIGALQERANASESDIDALETENAVQSADIQTNSQDIAKNRNDIDYLYQHITLAEDYIGQSSGTELPSNAALDSFVAENTEPSRPPKNGDVIIFILEIEGATDKNYKYVYSATGWIGYEIPPMEEAGNGSLGIVEGTYGIGSSNNILVDISGGQIRMIYFKDSAGSYRTLNGAVNMNIDLISKIISGQQTTGRATEAVRDQLGNVINTTYLDVQDGATKAYVQNYALPKSFNDVYYISAAGLVPNVPTTPASGVQFAQTVASVGTAELFSVERVLEAKYEFSQRNSTTNNIWVSCDVASTVEFKLTTQVKKAGDAVWTNLSVQLSGEMDIAANTIAKLTFSSNFSALLTTEIQLEIGDGLRQIFEAVTTDSSERTFSVYSSEVYPSDFTLNSTTAVINVNTLGEPKEIVLTASAFALNEDSGLYEAVIAQTAHGQPIGNKYIVQGAYMETASRLRAVGLDYSVDDGGNITVYAEEAGDYRVLIASAVKDDRRAIVSLTNPETLSAIDYGTHGAVTITQTEPQTKALTLKEPENVGLSCTVFIANSSVSTETVSVNGKTLFAGEGALFCWAGQWFFLSSGSV